MLFPCDLPGGTKKSAFHPRRTESFLADMRKSFEKRAAKNDGPHKNSRQEPEKRRKTSKIPLVGQASAALCAAASQHLAAVRGRHSLAETMFLAALTLLGLIGSQHLPHTSYYSKNLNGHRHRSHTKRSGLCRCLSVILRIRYIIDSPSPVCQGKLCKPIAKISPGRMSARPARRRPSRPDFRHLLPGAPQKTALLSTSVHPPVDNLKSPSKYVTMYSE